jgi:hypothetical protein
VLENSGSDHVTQIASRVIVALAVRLTISQTMQFAAFGIAEVIFRRASPAGLIASRIAEHCSERMYSELVINRYCACSSAFDFDAVSSFASN